MYVHMHVGGRFTALFSNIILSVFDVRVFLKMFRKIRTNKIRNKREN